MNYAYEQINSVFHECMRMKMYKLFSVGCCWCYWNERPNQHEKETELINLARNQKQNHTILRMKSIFLLAMFGSINRGHFDIVYGENKQYRNTRFSLQLKVSFILYTFQEKIWSIWIEMAKYCSKFLVLIGIFENIIHHLPASHFQFLDKFLPSYINHIRIIFFLKFSKILLQNFYWIFFFQKFY